MVESAGKGQGKGKVAGHHWSTWKTFLGLYLAVGLLQEAYINQRNHEPSGRITWAFLVDEHVDAGVKATYLGAHAIGAVLWPVSTLLVIDRWGKPWNNYDPSLGGGWAHPDSTSGALQ